MDGIQRMMACSLTPLNSSETTPDVVQLDENSRTRIEKVDETAPMTAMKPAPAILEVLNPLGVALQSRTGAVSFVRILFEPLKSAAILTEGPGP